MTTGERIKARRKELGISAETLAEELNVSAATVYRYEKGDIEKVPGTILEPLSKLLRTTPAYLMGWEDEPQRPSIFDIPNIIPLPKTKKVPLVGTIACGEPILAEQNIECYVDMEDNLNADFALRCRGDSMIGARITDGDVVFIRSQPDVDDGEIAAVLMGNEATLKRVYKIGSRLLLRAENPSFPPMEFSGEKLSEIKILGKAVGFISLNI